MLVVNRLLAMKVESVGLITIADGLLVHDGIHCLFFLVLWDCRGLLDIFVIEVYNS